MACEKCKHIGESYDGKPFIPVGGSCNAPVYACSCGEKWWQYNTYYHLWRSIPQETYDAVRFGQYIEIDVGTGKVVDPSDYFD